MVETEGHSSEGTEMALHLKEAQHESCELFDLGQSEDCSLRDSACDHSETLLGRGSGARSVWRGFCWRGVHALRHVFFAEDSVGLVTVAADHEEPLSPQRRLVLF